MTASVTSINTKFEQKQVSRYDWLDSEHDRILGLWANACFNIEGKECAAAMNRFADILDEIQGEMALIEEKVL